MKIPAHVFLRAVNDKLVRIRGSRNSRLFTLSHLRHLLGKVCGRLARYNTPDRRPRFLRRTPLSSVIGDLGGDSSFRCNGAEEEVPRTVVQRAFVEKEKCVTYLKSTALVPVCCTSCYLRSMILNWVLMWRERSSVRCIRFV